MNPPKKTETFPFQPNVIVSRQAGQAAGVHLETPGLPSSLSPWPLPVEQEVVTCEIVKTLLKHGSPADVGRMAVHCLESDLEISLGRGFCTPTWGPRKISRFSGEVFPPNTPLLSAVYGCISQRHIKGNWFYISTRIVRL